MIILIIFIAPMNDYIFKFRLPSLPFDENLKHRKSGILPAARLQTIMGHSFEQCGSLGFPRKFPTES